MKFLKKFIYLSSLILALACSRKSNPDPNSNLSAPVVDFSASQTSIYTGNVISFTDLSTEAPTSWLWNFQGGTPSTSTVQNPTNIQYNSAGTYTVTLTATNAYGNNTKTKTGYITVTDIVPQPSAPTLTTTAISVITNTTANTGGNVTNQGTSTVTERGVCWSINPTPTIANNKKINGSGVGSFISSLTGLAVNTTYYVRAYAINSTDTAYGNEQSFTTTSVFSNCGTVTDIDGNIYNTVIIGTQCWMQENLKTTRYKDGSAIPTNLSNTDWATTLNGAYAIYDNNPTNNTTYGKLYNWYAVSTGKLAPSGWHIPTDAEWTTLITYLGGDSLAGGAMKSTTLWNSPNVGATNSSGFYALPAGSRAVDPLGRTTYANIGNYSAFWSSTFHSTNNNYALFRALNYTVSSAGRSAYYKRNGFPVRCIKD